MKYLKISYDNWKTYGILQVNDSDIKDYDKDHYVVITKEEYLKEREKMKNEK